MIITPGNLYALDIETAPIKKDGRPYALEPYRLKQNLGKITSIAIAGPDGYSLQLDEQKDDIHQQLPGVLKSLNGKDVVAHNAPFDVAWMIEESDVELLRPIRWKCSALLAKWIYGMMTAKLEANNIVGAYISHIRLWETDSGFADYYPERERKIVSE